MSCCCLPKTTEGVGKFILRVTFGLALFLIGLKHLLTVGDFTSFVSADLGVLSPLGTLWAYIYSLLLVVGGALLVVDKYYQYAVWASGIALGSIVVGMLLKPLLGGADLGGVMPMVHNTWIWILVYFVVIKCSCCEK
jgi:hypothetical protein